jgi:putative endonuclease
MSRHWGEDIAKAYLLTKGYKVLAENYSIRGGEIDLVIFKDDITVFIEVRQRSRSTFGSAAESISAQKLARLSKTALHFMLKHYERDDLAMRFDAILISGNQANYRLEHLENISQ